MFNNKGTMIKYLIKQDTNIKEIDTAYPLAYSKECKKLDINMTNYVTIYYKNSHIEVINILDRLIEVYNKIAFDMIQNYYNDMDKLTNFYKLDKIEILFIDSILDSN